MNARVAATILLGITLALASVAGAGAADTPEHLIKFASLAPEGSSWMKQMRALDEAVRDSTGGAVGFKLYAGGVQGDEPDVLRKMRFGQLHAAGFTGNGLGEILPDVRILELPFFYRGKDEIDFVLDEFTDEYDRAFRERGYVLLGWTEVGYVYFFSNVPIRDLTDLHGIKVWTWQGDPLAAALFDALAVTPVPLSVPEVMTALQTGMIDAVYASPMAAVSLQWFTRVEYMNTQPITNSMGAVLLSKRVWDQLDGNEQRVLLSLSRDHLRRLTMLTRADNRKSIEEMEKAGIELLAPPDSAALARYREIGASVREQLAGELYAADLLAKIRQALERRRGEDQ